MSNHGNWASPRHRWLTPPEPWASARDTAVTSPTGEAFARMSAQARCWPEAPRTVSDSGRYSGAMGALRVRLAADAQQLRSSLHRPHHVPVTYCDLLALRCTNRRAAAPRPQPRPRRAYSRVTSALVDRWHLAPALPAQPRVAQRPGGQAQIRMQFFGPGALANRGSLVAQWFRTGATGHAYDAVPARIRQA